MPKGRENSVRDEREKKDGGGKGGCGGNDDGCKPVRKSCNKRLAISAAIIALVAFVFCLLLEFSP